MRILKILTISILTLWLTSCATTSEKNLPENKVQPKETRVQALSRIQSWNINGIIAVHNTEKKSNITANIKWQQHGNSFSMLLFGPMGASAIKLSGHPGSVRLETADGKTFTAPTPERLLAEQTNWNIPVSSLFYWIRGLSVPNIPAKTHFDTFNHLSQLEQQGWQIQFLNYTSVNHIDMPNKIFLYSPQLNVKIIINEWKL
jgi:outer membrane lipoprotein LolB